MTHCPVCMMPLHKGDDTFMSDKQFDKFYWPSLQKLFMVRSMKDLCHTRLPKASTTAD